MIHPSEDSLFALAFEPDDGEAAAALAPHLQECPACAERLAALQAEQALLYSGLAAPPLPEGLLERVTATISRTPRPRRSPRMKWFAAAAVVLVSASAAIWFASRDNTPGPETDGERAQLTPDPDDLPDKHGDELKRSGDSHAPETIVPDLRLNFSRDRSVDLPQEATVFGLSYEHAVDGYTKAVGDMTLADPSPNTPMREHLADPSPALEPERELAAKDKEIAGVELRAALVDELSGNSELGNTEAYQRIYENSFQAALSEPLSTFSVDVDRASYANTRRFLESGQLPPPDAVRIEELLNYFKYDDGGPAASDPHPVSIKLETASCPWQEDHRLVRIALKGREMDLDDRPGSNLVFLIDVSGSMNRAEKLPLLKKAMRLLINKLDARDKIAVVVYAGAAGLVLEPTSGAEKEILHAAMEGLSAGGSTNGGQGIQLAYDVAQQNFIKGGINRVILCTDGDFNVGTTSNGDLTRLVEAKAAGGVFLSLLGFGSGNYNDTLLETLSNKGNGNYAYIDSFKEAAKVFSRELLGTLWTIAKDVKLQVEFNPAQVAAYRLIGYENRIMAHQDFNDDSKDAGDIGVGHTVCALYQIVPAGVALPEGLTAIDPLKYGSSSSVPEIPSPELLTVKLRYKQPEDSSSQLLEVPLTDRGTSLDTASADLKFSAAVAAFGMLLRRSQHKGSASWGTVIELAGEGTDFDPGGDRRAFIRLAETAQELSTATIP